MAWWTYSGHGYIKRALDRAKQLNLGDESQRVLKVYGVEGGKRAEI